MHAMLHVASVNAPDVASIRPKLTNHFFGHTRSLPLHPLP